MAIAEDFWPSRHIPGGSLPSAPLRNAFDITPHDTNELEAVTRAIWVGVAGNLRVKTVGDDTVTFVGVGAGDLLPIRVKVVLSTGTSASSILGLY
jgi:hypothetical protein